MSSPLVSVCVPAYRAEAYLDSAIRSVLAQTFQHWELVIVDNASPDRTGQIARSYHDCRIRVHTNSTTVALADNWNLVVSRARGRYVKLLPADDLIGPDCLQAQFDDFESHPDVAVVACRRTFIDSRGRVVLPDRGLVGLVGEQQPRAVVDRLMRTGFNPIGEPAAFMFRRDDFFAVGAFDPSLPYPLDLSLAIRLLQTGTLYGESRTMAAFRIRSDSHTAGVVGAQGVEHRVLLRRLANDPRWSVSRPLLWRGLALTRTAALKRRLLYWSVSSRLPLVRRLPAIVTGSGRAAAPVVEAPELI